MTDTVALTEALLWLVGILGASLVSVVVFGVRRYLDADAKRREEMRVLENTVITTSQFNQWTARLDRRIESMETRFDSHISELRSDLRKIVASIVELLNKKQ